MKKKVMNIRPQELTANGERSVQYKGSDGKMHGLLPQSAAIPVKRNTVIPAGTELTLAEAHTINDFDFNKCSNLKFDKSSFSIYSEIEVNRDENGMKYLYLHYPGNVAIYTKTNGTVFEPFEDTDEATKESGNFAYPYDDAKNIIAEKMLAIAKQTGTLVIYHGNQYNVMTPGYYEETVILTLGEDLITGEEFFVSKNSGELVKIGLPNNAAIPVAHRSIIAGGTEITLEQARAIEGFDFNNCSSLRFNEEFNIYNSFLVNPEDSSNSQTSRYLDYAYPGNPRIRYYKDGHYYQFQPTSEAITTLNYANDEQGAQSHLEQVMLEIAQETGNLEIFSTMSFDSESNSLPRTYESAVLLTIKNDILLSEEFFLESFSGDLLRLATVSEDSDEQEVEEPHPYSLDNNPKAYEIIDSGQTIYNGNKKYIAKACDGTETTIDSNTLYEILLKDPNTTLILKDDKPGLTGSISTAILRITEIYERNKNISLTGRINGNTTHSDYYITVNGKSTENWITLTKTTS